MKDIKYGSREKTEFIDDNGSTKTLEEKFHAGEKSTKPVRVRYAIRYRTDKTDLQTLSDIAKDLLTDPMKLDGELKLERSPMGEMEGTYTIVACYTEVEY